MTRSDRARSGSLWAALSRRLVFGAVPAVASASVVLLSLCLLASSAAGLGVGVGVAPTYPPIVTVGDTNLHVSLTATNTSTSPENGGTVTLSAIRHTPSCGTDSTPCPSGFEDPGVFLAKGPATGRTGTACAGMTFTLGPVDPTTGEFEFIPSASVVLQPPGTANGLDACTIDFLVDVLKLPTKDSDPEPGIQTDQLGRVSGTAAVNGVTGTGTGSGLTTVQQPTPTPISMPSTAAL